MYGERLKQERVIIAVGVTKASFSTAVYILPLVYYEVNRSSEAIRIGGGSNRLCLISLCLSATDHCSGKGSN